MKLKILFLSLFIYTIVGFFVVPFVAKSTIVKMVEQKTSAKVKIDSIYFNPFTFKIKINSLKLLDINNKKLLSFNLFEINLEPHSLFLPAIHIKEIKLQNPKVFLVYDKNKKLNISKVLKPTEKTESSSSSSKLPRIIVEKTHIANGSIFYEDYSKKDKFETSLENLDFTLKSLDTTDIVDASIKLNFEIDNDALVKVDTTFVSLEPLVLNGYLSIDSFKLYTEYKYIKENLNLEVADGELSLDTNFFFTLEDLNATNLTNLSLNINKLRLKPKEEHHNILTLKSFSIENATIYPIVKKANIKNIILDTLDIDANMDKKGRIDWLNYAKVNFDTNNTKSKKQTKTKQWDISVNDIYLKSIGGKFDDKSIKPSVLTELNSLDIDIKDFNSLVKRPFEYKIQLILNDRFKCNSNGSILSKNLDISSYIKCSNFDITHYKPYIKRFTDQKFKKFNLDLKKAELSFMANIKLEDDNSTLITYIDDANISLDNFKLNKKTTKERLVSFKKLYIKDIKLNTKDKEVQINQTKLKYLSINPRRYTNGKLNFDNLVVDKKVKKRVVKGKITHKKDYSVKVDSFLLQASQVNFRDRVLQPTVKTRLHNIYIKLVDIDSKNPHWIRYYFNARLNSKGHIKARGKINPIPLKEKGIIEFKNISLNDFSPYVENKAFVKVANGTLNLKTKLEYAKSVIKSDLTSNGSLKLDYFFLNDTRDNSSLFAINHLDIKSFAYEMNPDKLFINNVDLDSFYINAVINKDKSMNFSHLLKDVKISTKKSTIDDNKSIKKPFPIWVLQTNIKNGSAGFADHSLPIDFDTQIHDVSGVLYAISSLGLDTSYLDIDGEVDAYGSAKLKGNINLSNVKQYTDLGLNFRNLSLDSVSGYSATFAGYKIDDGKLFLDLKYDIKDSKLNSSNNILIKHIKIGSEYKDTNTTPLPLKFAVALLEDSDGVIDISMPIVGDVNNPDFKYGSLVMKTFFKLIGNAITSPFRFIGSALGIDGDKLSYIEFEPAKINILPSEREKLDNLVKMMIKKPKIAISISGTYNTQVDKLALKKRKLIEKILKDFNSTNIGTHIGIMSIDSIEEIYHKIIQKDDLEEIKKKAKDNYKQVLIDLLIESQSVTKDELLSLANQRVDMIKSYLIDKKSIKPSRILKKDISISNDIDEKYIKLNLSIEVK